MFSGNRNTISLCTVGLVLLTLSDSVSSIVGPDQTKVIFHYGPDFNDSQTYDLSDATSVLQHPKFNNNETHCYFHGYHESQASESIHVIVEAYHKRGTVNLLSIDWDKAAGEDFLSDALINIELLAPALADTFLELYKAGLPRESFTVVAHSLGAQLAGMAARQMQRKTNGTVQIYKMAALDAGFPLFFNFSFFLRTVSKTDVEFLQAIHTDIGVYGMPQQLGDVDFWPNGGLRGQPGCPRGSLQLFKKEDLCSHQRSWRFWAESVADETGPYFWSYPSDNYVKFLLDCSANSNDNAIQMGFNCPMDARGNYFLRTNSESPFAKGYEF